MCKFECECVAGGILGTGPGLPDLQFFYMKINSYEMIGSVCQNLDKKKTKNRHVCLTILRKGSLGCHGTGISRETKNKVSN